MKKAYAVSALVGNVGGFIGLFLGYALLMFPELLKTIILHILMRRSNAPVEIIQKTALENSDLNEMKQKLVHLSSIISHIHDEMASMQAKMADHF